MKPNKFLITLALCAMISSNISFGSQETQTQSSSYWLPQTLQDLGAAASQKAISTYQSTRDYAASWVPQSIKDRVNTWSNKKKMAVAAATLGALLAIYNRDVLMQWISDILNPEKAKLRAAKNKFLIAEQKFYNAHYSDQTQALTDEFKNAKKEWLELADKYYQPKIN